MVASLRQVFDFPANTTNELIGVLTYVMMEQSRMMTCPQVQRLPSKSRTTWTRHQAR